MFSEKISINVFCYMLTNKLILSTFTSFFKVPYFADSNYICLKSTDISSIIKVNSENKLIFLYDSGNIVFVDFSSSEVNAVINYLSSIIDKIDYMLINKFNESLTLTIENNILIKINNQACNITYNEETLKILCHLMSNANTLSSVEDKVSLLLLDTEIIVKQFQQDRIRIYTKRFSKALSYICRFQYGIVTSISSLYSFSTSKRNANSKIAFNMLLHHYEIDERIHLLVSKINHVNKLIYIYNSASYNRQELRLLIFECILLSMFLIPHIIDFKAIFSYFLLQ